MSFISFNRLIAKTKKSEKWTSNGDNENLGQKNGMLCRSLNEARPNLFELGYEGHLG